MIIPHINGYSINEIEIKSSDTVLMKYIKQQLRSLHADYHEPWHETGAADTMSDEWHVLYTVFEMYKSEINYK